MLLFYPNLGRIASLCNRIQALFHNRIGCSCRFSLFKVRLRIRVDNFQLLCTLFDQLCHIGQIHSGGSAAVVANAPEIQGHRFVLRIFQELFQFFSDMSVNGVIIFIGTMHQNLRPCQTFPQIILFLERKLCLRRTADHISIISCLIQNLNQTYRMTKRVKINCRRRANAKLFFKKPVSFRYIADNGLAVWHIAVGL